MNAGCNEYAFGDYSKDDFKDLTLVGSVSLI